MDGGLQADAPLVSIVITTYYRDDALEAAIESALEQTYRPVEVVIVDDSGEGFARQICEGYDVTYVPKEENEGQIAAWNTGVERANGEYIQFLDDDDRLFPEKIEAQVAVLRDSPDIGVVHCGIRWDFGVDDHPNADLKGDVLCDVLTLDTSPCITSTMLIRREVLADVVPIARYPGATDDVLKIELSQRTAFDYVDDILVHRGTGGDNVSASMAPVEANRQILREYAHLYDDVDPEIRRRALSKTLYREGYAHLNGRLWSADAVRAFGKSVYVCPGRGLRPLLVFLLSLGGHPALSLFETCGTVLKRAYLSVRT